jgi:hypothetical protein
VPEPIDHGKDTESEEAKAHDGLEDPERRNHPNNFTAGDSENRPLPMTFEVDRGAINFWADADD